MKAKAFGKHALSRLLIVLCAILPGIFAQGSVSLAKFSQEELDQLLAPIALYPDSLLAQILRQRPIRWAMTLLTRQHGHALKKPTER